MEELLFKNTSKMDDKEISLFQNFALKKNIIISAIVFTLLFVGGGIGLCFYDLTMGITLIVCGVLGGAVLLPYLMKEQLKKENKIRLGDRKYLNTFEFYQSYCDITSEATADAQSNDYKPLATQKLEYRLIYKVVFYREYLFMYINKRQSFIINSRGMTLGTVGELVKHLESQGVKIVDKSSKEMTNKK